MSYSLHLFAQTQQGKVDQFHVMKQQQSVFRTGCTFPDLLEKKEVKLTIDNLRHHVNTLPSISRDNKLPDTSYTSVSPESLVTSNLYCVITPLRWEGAGGSQVIINEVEESDSTVILVGAPEGTVIRDIHRSENMQCIKITSTHTFKAWHWWLYRSMQNVHWVFCSVYNTFIHKSYLLHNVL